MATSIGHAPAAALADPAAGSVLSIAEVTYKHYLGAPYQQAEKCFSFGKLDVALQKSRVRMQGYTRRLKLQVILQLALGINIPTGKDSLSMTQKYRDKVVYSPGTVIISASGEVNDIRKIVEPVVVNDPYSSLLYIDMSRDSFKPGGSSFAQVVNSIGDEVPTVKDAVYFAEVFNSVQELIRNNKVMAGHDISAGGMLTTLLEMCFSNTSGGLSVDLSAIDEPDIIKILFSQNPGIIIQVKDVNEVAEFLLENGISYFAIGHPVNERIFTVTHGTFSGTYEIDSARATSGSEHHIFSTGGRLTLILPWRGYGIIKITLSTSTSTLTINMRVPLSPLGSLLREGKKSGIRSAIIREKGVNGDREMAYALYLAGFDVKDVHMTDLMSGRETLEDINMIVFVGGFSNSDVLGSAKGWAGAFRYNAAAGKALENFYRRKDTLSLGVCNGCQLMAELGLICPDHEEMPKLLHNKSGKFESSFLSVKIQENNSVMLGNMSGLELGVWVAHGEGQFRLPYSEEKYNIPLKYSHHTYPANPNGSDYDTAAICSDDGRHLVMMPHLERAFFPWQCAYYPAERKNDDVTPWIKAFVNARKWIEDNTIKKGCQPQPFTSKFYLLSFDRSK